MIGIRVTFHKQFAGTRFNAVFIGIKLGEIFNHCLPYAVRDEGHGIGFTFPVIEISYYRNADSVRGPYAETVFFHAVFFYLMYAEKLIAFVIFPLIEQIKRKIIRILCFCSIHEISAVTENCRNADNLHLCFIPCSTYPHFCVGTILRRRKFPANERVHIAVLYF